MKKRIISIILAVIMIIAMMPTMAFAIKSLDSYLYNAMCGVDLSDNEAFPYTTPDENNIVTVFSDDNEEGRLFTVSDNNGERTIKLFANIPVENNALVVPNGKKIILDLNGHVLNRGLIQDNGTPIEVEEGINGSAIMVENGGELTIRDSDTNSPHTFKEITEGDNKGLWVLDEENGDQTVKGGIITGGNSNHGGGVLILGGNLIMEGGNIVGNYSSDSGGGVCVGDRGQSNYGEESNFTMKRGSITGNVSYTWGGGVCVGPGAGSSSNFLMEGGTISGNKAKDGGGVHVGGGSRSTFTMTDGEITGNEVTGTDSLGGGGVSVYFYNANTNYAFTMTGGEITNNKANSSEGGGVFVHGDGNGSGTVTLGGTAKISENKKGTLSGGEWTNLSDNNLYLPSGKTITLGDGKSVSEGGNGVAVPVTTGDTKMSVGITTKAAPTDENTIQITTNDSENYVRNFFSDNPEYAVTYRNDHLELIKNHWFDLQKALKGTTAETVPGLFEISDSTIKLLADFKAEAGDNTLTVSGTKTLDLNGYVINANGENISVITVPAEATLNLCDSETRSNVERTHAGYIDENGLWHLGAIPDGTTACTGKNITGGIITGGNLPNNVSGGGVDVTGTFNMNGGNIVGNTLLGNSGNGGGVYVTKASGSFTMSGNSRIVYNHAPNGGGVGVGSSARFTMTDGAIENNTATNGGGVFVMGASLTMTNGSINNNTATTDGGGVFDYGTVILGGTAKISGNFKGKIRNNLYLYNGKSITLGTKTGDSDAEVGNGVAVPVVNGENKMSIGVTMGSANGKGQFTANGNGTMDQAKCFLSDNTNYYVNLHDGDDEDKTNDYLELREKPAPYYYGGGSTKPEPKKNPFVDVLEKEYFYDPVMWAAENKITAGTDATHFSPGGTTTRGQMITFLWRMAGSPIFEDDGTKFTDIKKSDYFYDAVVWGWNIGVINGKTEEAFAPEDNVTRGEAVSFIYRYAKVAGGDLPNPFNDVKQGAFYYYPVLWAANNEITNGTSATMFAPENDCTRGQIVTFLYRFDLKN